VDSIDRLSLLLEIRRLAAKVRECQKRYFRTRDRSDLIESKEYERLLDAELATWGSVGEQGLDL